MWLVAGKILLPGLSVLERAVARVRLRSASHLHRRLAEGIDAEARLRLDRLVAVPEGERQSPLDRLRDGPFIQSGPEISRSLLRLGEVQSFVQELPKIDRIPPGKITALWKFASAARVQAVARLPEERRTATLLAFIHTLEASAAERHPLLAHLRIAVLYIHFQQRLMHQLPRREAADPFDGRLGMHDGCWPRQ